MRKIVIEKYTVKSQLLTLTQLKLQIHVLFKG